MHVKEDPAEAACGCTSCSTPDHMHDHAKRRANILLIITGFFALLGLALHLLSLSEDTLITQAPWFTPAFIAQAVAVVGSLTGLTIIAPKVIESVRARRVDINILMLVAVVGAWILRDFSEAAIVVFLFCVGEWFENLAVRRNRESISSLMKLTPEMVLVQRGDHFVELMPEQVRVGEHMVIRPGERVPLDGVVLEGAALLDEAAITGESMPVHKQAGAEVYAGALSVDGRLVVASTTTVEDSTLARIVKLVKESQAQRSPYERTINRFARYYTPLVLLSAMAVAVIPTALSALTPLALGGIEVWGYRALSVLVIGCPCALVIATPVSVVSGLARAARAGILIKGGVFLELGARVNATAFDKTGTLTYGEPEVSNVMLLAAARGRGYKSEFTENNTSAHLELTEGKLSVGTEFTKEAVLILAAALERASTHPVAVAITSAADQLDQAAQVDQVNQALQQGGRVDLTIEDIIEHAGRGIAGTASGVRVAVGSIAFAKELGVLTPEAYEVAEGIQASAASAQVVIYGDAPIAVFAVRDKLREESPAVIARLSAAPLSQQTALLSGDNVTVAKAIAKKTGITEVKAGLLPHEKKECIEALKQEHGIIAMVGDGINDAPALAVADIGIAANAAASDTALEVADVALMAARLDALPRFFKLARMSVRTIRINIVFALVFKIAVLVLVIAGMAGMWAAIAADVGVLILVLLHSMTLLRRKL